MLNRRSFLSSLPLAAAIGQKVASAKTAEIALRYSSAEITLQHSTDAIWLPYFIQRKLSGYERGAIPSGCNRLTAGVCVTKRANFWVLRAWRDDGSGSTIDYGCDDTGLRAGDTLDQVSLIASIRRCLAAVPVGTRTFVDWGWRPEIVERAVSGAADAWCWMMSRPCPETFTDEYEDALWKIGRMTIFGGPGFDTRDHVVYARHLTTDTPWDHYRSASLLANCAHAYHGPLPLFARGK